jgi:hypothetical protein
MKAAYLDNELGMEGYKFVKTSKSGDSSYQNWYNSSKNKCITVRVADGKVQSIVDSPNDCNETNNNYNNSNNNFNNNNNYRDLQDLVGARGSDSEYQLGQRGYTLSKTDKSSGYDVYQNWYNSSLRKCVTVRISDGKVQSIVDSPNDCNSSNNSGNRYGSGNRKQEARYYDNYGKIRYKDLVNESATYAYEELGKRGFYEVKNVNDGATTYKLWKNDETYQCIKTTSRGQKITTIINSTNCK